MSRSSASAPPSLISAREALAHEAGLHRTFIGHVEQQARNISLDNVERIAHVFGLQAHQLLAPVAGPRNPGSWAFASSDQTFMIVTAREFR